jgi:creatinine amidohydrolase
MSQPPDRIFGHLTSPQVTAHITANSVLCLPVGSLEQHGPRLPLTTDTIIAQAFAEALAEHAAPRHDLWVLPPVSIGLSREHRWAPGTTSLRLTSFAASITQLTAEYLHATAAGRLVIVNGHGGNRGAIEVLLYELEDTFGITACALHPLALAAAGTDISTPEVHAGFGETSLMLHLAPQLVRFACMPASGDDEQASAVRATILGRGASWPWRTDDRSLATSGVIGDPRTSTAEHGRTILAEALRAANKHLDRLAEAQPDHPKTD